MTDISGMIFLGAAGAIAGAIVGSFLTVVIQRLPKLIDAADGNLSAIGFLKGISSPPSHCPCCGHRIAWRDNIPIAAYMLRGGRCRSCGVPYGIRYLIVEIATAAVFASYAIAYGLTARGILGAIFAAGLIALTVIDIEEQLLPDVLLLPLFGLGLLFQGAFGNGIGDALLGAGTGAGALWLIRRLYQSYRNVEGLGLGDVKFAGVIGVWIGLSALPMALFIAFAAGTLVMLPAAAMGRVGTQTAVPFGPFLALGGFCVTVLPNLQGFAAALFS